ncbi:hypothetical protein M9Y10_007952 [Tritrichomonas musculus]|uniref:RGS domain-containing protein n=1 Tax=Tritrichomonas musculus TaxID=1915356 RepID=A0ABR2J2S3_9EUKA
MNAVVGRFFIRNETIQDQSEVIKTKNDEIINLKDLIKKQSNQFEAKIEVEHYEKKYMREFLLQHVRNQFLETKSHSSAEKLWSTIDDMFNDANVFELFTEFCKNKLCPEYIYYIEDMAAYYNMKEDCKPLLFFDFRDKNFKEGAPYFLNIQVNVIKEIRAAKEPAPELLDKVLQLVYAVCKVQLIVEIKYSSKYIEYMSNPKNHRRRSSKKFN